jgi:pyruvate kinase
MLSGETSIGKYPVQAVDVLDRIARRVERSGGANYAEKAAVADPREKLAHSAVIMANDLHARALIVFTRYGQMPKLVSWLRPRYSAIFAFTDSPRMVRQMQMLWGVIPFEIKFDQDPEKTVAGAVAILKKHDLVRRDDWVVSISHIISAGRAIDSVQMRTVE